MAIKWKKLRRSSTWELADMCGSCQLTLNMEWFLFLFFLICRGAPLRFWKGWVISFQSNPSFVFEFPKAIMQGWHIFSFSTLEWALMCEIFTKYYWSGESVGWQHGQSVLKTLLAFLPLCSFRALGCGFAGPCHGPIGNLDLMPGDFLVGFWSLLTYSKFWSRSKQKSK